MIKSLATAFLLVSSQAPAQPAHCIPPADAGRMVTALLPTIIDTLASQCSAHLPAGAFLGERSHVLAERMRTETAADRAAAVATIMTMTGQNAPAAGQDPEQLIRVLAESFASEADPVKCRGASDLIEALAPLPTANFAQAFAAVLGVAAAEAGEDGPPICHG